MKDSLGDRMKQYEYRSRIFLPTHEPVIIRIDGRAFHSFTRGLQRPFDSVLIQAMQDTAKKLCESIAGCKIAYVQSDEISLLLVDYDRPETQAWFGNNLQKLASVSASIATMEFNRVFGKDAEVDDEEYAKTLRSKWGIATFDARAFVLPKDEVCNYFIWRQKDAMRNSVSMIANTLFSHKMLDGKSTEERKAMIETAGVPWGKIPVVCRHGSCICRVVSRNLDSTTDKIITRHHWIVDTLTPSFIKDRSYIEKYVYVRGAEDE